MASELQPDLISSLTKVRFGSCNVSSYKSTRIAKNTETYSSAIIFKYPTGRLVLDAGSADIPFITLLQEFQ